VAEWKLSARRACAAVGLSRAAYYRPVDSVGCDDEIVGVLNRLVEAHPRWGFWKCYDRLRRDGYPWNHKRVWRVYCAMRLNLKRRTKRRVPTRERQSMDVAAMPNVVWGLDFMSDALYSGRRFRTFNILDEGVREALDIVIDTSIQSGRVVRALETVASWRGYPTAIRCDNGPELLAQEFVDWCTANQVEPRYIQRGKPNQNAFVERFNRTYRTEVLDAYLFERLEDVRRITEEWIREYNEDRPHDAIGRIPPSEFRRQIEAKVSTFGWST
jgi:putative transposase